MVTTPLRVPSRLTRAARLTTAGPARSAAGIVCYDGSGHISGVALSEVAYVPANGKATFSGVGDIPTAPARCDAWAYPGFGVGLGLPPTP